MEKIILCVGLSILTAFIMRILNVLTDKAAVLLGVLLFIVLYWGSYKMFLALLLIFSMVVVVDLIVGKKSKSITKGINQKNGARDAIQILSNCLIAVIAVLLCQIVGNVLFTVVFFAVISETVGDSMASDIGVLSKRCPIDICTFKTIEPGLSGGVSVLGFFASLIVCMYCALVYYFLFNKNILFSFVILFCAMFGVVCDSLIGSKLQAKYKCIRCNKITEKNVHCGMKTVLVSGMKFLDNCMVNFVSNIISAIVSTIIMSLMLI